MEPVRLKGWLGLWQKRGKWLKTYKQTKQKQKKLLHERGFSKLKASRAKNSKVYGHISVQ